MTDSGSHARVARAMMQPRNAARSNTESGFFATFWGILISNGHSDWIKELSPPAYERSRVQFGVWNWFANVALPALQAKG
jgi:hypothetical protein